MNKVILVGRLTRDPEIRQLEGQDPIAMARFTVAVDRRFTRRQEGGDNQQPTADFIGCVAFRKTAEFAGKYLHQGTKVVLEGRIQTGSYTNKEGQKVYTTDVVAENLEFAESKSASQRTNDGNSNGNNSGYNAPTPQNNPAPDMTDGFMNIPDGVEDEGLPFN